MNFKKAFSQVADSINKVADDVSKATNANKPAENLKEYLTQVVKWLQTEVTKAKAKGVIVGVSGGIDSALVACLMKEAFPEQHLAVIMPCLSSPEDEQLAKALLEEQKIKYVSVALDQTFEQITKSLEKTKQLGGDNKTIVQGNMKARLRMTTLYALAQANNYLVLGTDNADEWYVGYFTKFGDGAADLLPIIHLLKGQVNEAAALYGVSPDIITRKPTAGLYPNQTDEAELKFSYSQLDEYLQGINTNITPEIKARIEALHEQSGHKRIGAPTPAPFKKLLKG